MRAIVYSQYGSPDVLEYKEIPVPEPGENELLLKVHAAAANPLDWHYMRGTPWLMRLMSGLFRPKKNRLGVDLAAEVFRTGQGVTQHEIGDSVFGIVPNGSFAEFVKVPESSALHKMPAGLSYEQAAAFPVAAITALQGLRDCGKVQQGQKVLVNGASGGVGTFAIQLARYFGAEVTGVCSTTNLEMVLGLGAHKVIDYTREDFTRGDKAYDLIFDLVGNRSVGHYKRSLRKGGRCVICGFSSSTRLIQHLILGPLQSFGSNRKVGMMPTAKPNKADLEFLARIAESGSLKAVIDRRYTLQQTAEAIRYLETGHARGKIIIGIDPVLDPKSFV